MVGLVEKPEHITTQWFKDAEEPSFSWENPPISANRCRAWAEVAYLQVMHGQRTVAAPLRTSRLHARCHDGFAEPDPQRSQ